MLLKYMRKLKHCVVTNLPNNELVIKYWRKILHLIHTIFLIRCLPASSCLGQSTNQLEWNVWWKLLSMLYKLILWNSTCMISYDLWLCTALHCMLCYINRKNHQMTQQAPAVGQLVALVRVVKLVLPVELVEIKLVPLVVQVKARLVRQVKLVRLANLVPLLQR